MIELHWDGIAAYCRPENKVSLGFVEGLNNTIRVIQFLKSLSRLVLRPPPPSAAISTTPSIYRPPPS
jgi:hypothetical protein